MKCEDKRAYSNKDKTKAKLMARKWGHVIYRCRSCGNWHLTHIKDWAQNA